jgi:nitrile hydratase accessory protein
VSFDDWVGDGAPPRDNGELVFEAPWHARAFAMAVALVDQLQLPWTEFQSRLIAAIADDPDRPYYESWAAALESLVVDHGLATPDAITAATPTERAPL